MHSPDIAVQLGRLGEKIEGLDEKLDIFNENLNEKLDGHTENDTKSFQDLAKLIDRVGERLDKLEDGHNDLKSVVGGITIKVGAAVVVIGGVVYKLIDMATEKFFQN